MNDEELAVKIIHSLGGPLWADFGEGDTVSDFKARVVRLLRESRRQRLEGREGRLQEIADKAVVSADVAYLLVLVVDQMFMIHDLQAESTAYEPFNSFSQ